MSEAAAAAAAVAAVSYLDNWNYPKPPRREQVDILDFISASESNTVIVHAPTGVGKSAICSTLAKADSGAVITPHKLLQDQYLRDWPKAKLVKGKVNYPCATARMKQSGEKHTITGTSCKAGAGWCHDLSCPYKCAKDEFLASNMGVTNYNWLLSSLRGDVSISQNWLLFDEAHELEPKLIESAAIEITDEMCAKYHVQFETFDNTEDAREWLFGKVQPALKRALEILEAKATSGKSGDPKTVVEISDLQEVLGSIGFYIMMEDEEPWVYSASKDNRSCYFKPLYAAGLFSRFIEPMGKRHLITSATLSPGKLIQKWLGLSHFDEIAVPSPFPLKNRMVYVKSVAYLNKDNLDEMLPKVVEHIDMILDDSANEKGIIHCHSFALGEKIFKLSNHKGRLLKHDSTNTREELLQQHCSSKFPTVLLSPSMTEGIDLPDDLSRFTIIPKCPFPYLGDKWVMTRRNEDEDWYDWQIAKTIMQGIGRSVRHSGDWANAYILDGSFSRFYDRKRRLFPKWFRDSIQRF